MAERKRCRECQILRVGLIAIDVEWAEYAASEEPLLREDTQLVIFVRTDHSLRLIVSNIDLEAAFGFYTVRQEGMRTPFK